MDFIEKARMRIEHWIKHNEDHLKEYDAFAEQLETIGKNESARHIRGMIELTAKSNESLHKALKSIE